MFNSRLKYLSVLTLGTVIASTAHAQFLRGLQDRLVEAVEKRVEQNVEDRVIQNLEQGAGKAVDQSFSAMFGVPGAMADGTEGTESTGSLSILSRMMDTSNITVEDEYTFNLAATFEMQSFDSNGKASEPMEMVFHYADNAPYTGTRMLSGEGAQAGAAMMIYDFDNQVMLMLMDADGSRFAMAYNWAIASAEWNTAWELSPEEAAASTDVPQFEPIGSRTINGYASEGYRTTYEEQISEIWISDEVAPGIERIFQANRTVPMMNASMPAGYPQGMIMELNSENTQTGEKVQMRTVSIDTDNDVTFRMRDYPLMSLGALAGEG